MPGTPIVGSTLPDDLGVSRLRLRNRLADELGFLQATTVSTTATNGDTARVVLANEMRDDEAGYWVPDFLWVYVRNGAQAGVARRVIGQPDAGYQGSRAALMVSRPFAAALASGSVVEVTSPLPGDRVGMVKGLNQAIDEALSMIRVPARLAFTGNGGYSYTLPDWLVHEGQTTGIYDAQHLVVSDPLLVNEASTYEIAAGTSGVDRTLVTTRSYSAAETFHLGVMAPADRLVFDGAAWSYIPVDGTPGLLDDDYQTAAPERWVIAFAMVKALEFLDRYVVWNRGMPEEAKAPVVDQIRVRRAKWVQTALRIKLHEMPQTRARRVEPMVSVGSGYAWN